jgi:hypothetical protein
MTRRAIDEISKAVSLGIQRMNDLAASCGDESLLRIKGMACGSRNRERFHMAFLFNFGRLGLGF